MPSAPPRSWTITSTRWRTGRASPRRPRASTTSDACWRPMSRAPAAGRETAASDRESVLGQQALGAVVPDLHADDQPVAHGEAVDVAVALERRAVRPGAVQGAEAVDRGDAVARHHVQPFHPLLHPGVAPGIEG